MPLRRPSSRGALATLALLTVLCTPALALDPGKPPGQNFDLGNFTLVLPVDRGDGNFVTIAQPQLATYSSDFFYTGVDGAMVFWCPVTAFKGDLSKPQATLRNLRNWPLAGTNLLTGVCKVRQVPSTNELTFAQIGGNATTLGALIWSNGALVFRTRTTPNGDYISEGLGNAALGDTLTFSLKQEDNRLTATINGRSSTRVYDSSWDAGRYYFFLCANPNDNTGPGTEGALVAFYALGVTLSPTITSQPLSQTADIGASLSFTVGALGDGLTYQWQKNGGAIRGATTATLTLPDVQPADAGGYAVVVANAGGAVTSAAAMLTVSAVALDDFDKIRLAWRTTLTGGNLYSPTDPDIAIRLGQITSSAKGFWTSMDKSPGRTFLWSDLTDGNNSHSVQPSYDRLLAMALGYTTIGSGLYGNAALRADIVSGLDWLYANWYNESKVIDYKHTGYVYNIRWGFEIGVPLDLNDMVTLLYRELSGEQIAKYMKASEHYMPRPIPTDGYYTGANLMNKCKILAMRGAILKDAATVNRGISELSNNLTNIFVPVTKGDGFYVDGSFIQHDAQPYNGGYGTDLIRDVCDFVGLYRRPPFAVTDPDAVNVFKWLRGSFEPFVYRGEMMEGVMGRFMSRQGAAQFAAREVCRALLRAAQFAPASEAAHYQSVVKSWLTADTTCASPYDGIYNVYDVVLLKIVLNNPAIAPERELVRHYHFGSMDRAVHLGPGWAAALSMHSTRIMNFEGGPPDPENFRGWHTSDGMLYLYTSDLNQFRDNFWPTVDSFRMPGTTVEAGSTEPYRTQGDANKVGGVRDYSGRLGLAAMDLGPPGSTVRGKKAWFFSDNKIVCLGAGLAASGSRPLETIVENRVLNAAGSNTFLVNGAAQLPTLQTAPAAPKALVSVQTAHLTGNATDGSADIGYFFPARANLTGLREQRSGAWYDINTLNQTTTTCTNRFLTLWYDHGLNPTNAGYAYAVLPMITPAELQSYASAPDFSILENSSAAQAIKEIGVNAEAAIFWNAQSKTVGTGNEAITVDNVAAVYLKLVGSELQVSVADPTQANTGMINVELGRRALSVIDRDNTVTVIQLSPTIKISVNVANKAGAPQYVRFVTDTPPAPAAPANLAANPGNGLAWLSWTASPTATAYNVKRAASSSGPYSTIAWSVTDISYVDFAVSNGKPYYYVVTALNDGGEGEASTSIRVVPAQPASANASRLTNVSILTSLATAGETLTIGYVVGGGNAGGTKPLVIRAAGPSLGAFGVAGALDDPKLELFTGATKVGENDNWGGTVTLANAMSAVGAFAYSGPTSSDAAVALSVASGDNSVKVSGVGGCLGAVLAELYDGTPSAGFTAATPRLINLSVLKQVGTGFTAGFVVAGNGTKTVLIRAIGPTLGSAFGLPGVVADPMLALYSGRTAVASNDNWGGGATLAAAFSSVGAFVLPPESRDAAIVASLNPGNYTVQVADVARATGLILVEIYELP